MIAVITGGPGCTGEGFSVITGPFRGSTPDNKTGAPVENTLSWVDKYNILYLDFPGGVGYSVYGGDDNKIKSTWKVAEYTQNFFVRFYELFPELKTNGLYFAGLSYGGHSAPAMASYLVENQ